MIKKICMTVLGIILIYGCAALAMKAGIGVTPVDAIIATMSAIIGMKVGTFSILFHGSFFVGQLILEGRKFRKSEFLQLVYITLGGSVLNFFLYFLLKNVTFSAYPVRFIVMLAAFLISAFGCTLVLETHLMRIPLEGFLQLIAERMGTTLGKLRQKTDIALVLLCVALTLIFGTDWTLREATVIAALIFGPAMDFWKKTFFTAKRSTRPSTLGKVARREP